MLDWSTKDSKTESGFFEWLFKISTTFLHWQTHKALRISFASNLFFSHSELAFFGQNAMATLVCLPLKTACHAQPGLAWVDQSSRIKNAFIVF